MDDDALLIEKNSANGGELYENHYQKLKKVKMKIKFSEIPTQSFFIREGVVKKKLHGVA